MSRPLLALVCMAVVHPVAGAKGSRLFEATQFIVDRMVVPFHAHDAVRQSEHAHADDRWFLTGDNARALEVLTMPGVYERYQHKADGILSYILSMSSEGYIMNGAAEQRIEVTQEEEDTFVCENNLHRHHFKVPSKVFQGFVRQESAAVVYEGFLVKLTIGGQETSYFSGKIPLKSTVDSARDTKTIIITADLDGKADVEYRYRVHAGSVLSHIEVRVKSKVPKMRVEVLTRKSFGKGKLAYGTLCHKYVNEPASCVMASTIKKNSMMKSDGLQWYSVLANGPMGSTPAYHTPVNHSDLVQVKIKQAGDAVTWIDNSFVRESLDQDETFTVTDRGVLTQGGLHTTVPYDKLFANFHSYVEDTHRAVDFSMSRDYGTVIASVASFAGHLKRNRYKGITNSQKRGEQYNQWALKQLKLYADNVVEAHREHVHSRSHSDAVVAAVKLAVLNNGTKAALDVAVTLNALLAALLDVQIMQNTSTAYGAFPCHMGAPSVPTASCHSAAIHALAYVLATHGRIPYQVTKTVLLHRLSLALRAFPYVSNVRSIGDSSTHVRVVANTTGLVDTVQSALALRAVKAVVRALRIAHAKVDDDAEVRALALRHLASAGVSHAAIRRTRDGSDYMEFPTTPGSGRTDSEAQPSAILAFFSQYDHFDFLKP